MADVATGARAYVDMSFEKPDGTPHVDKFLFGKFFELRNASVAEGQTNQMTLNNIEVVGFTYGQLSRSLGFAWVMSSPWFVEAVMGRGSRATVTNSGLNTHTYTVKKEPQTFETRLGFDVETDELHTYKGCLLNQVGISTRVGGTVDVTANAISGTEGAQGAVLDVSPGIDAVDNPYTFEHSTIEVPSGTAVDNVQQLSLDINPNYNLLYGLGQKSSVDSWKGAMEYSGSVQVPKKGTAFLTRVTQRAETASMKIKFTNGLSAGAEKSLTLMLTGVGFSEGSYAAKSVELIQDTYNFTARSLSVIAINDEASPLAT